MNYIFETEADREIEFVPGTDTLIFSNTEVDASFVRLAAIDADGDEFQDLQILMDGGANAGLAIVLLDTSAGMLTQNDFSWFIGSSFLVVGDNDNSEIDPDTDDGANSITTTNDGDYLMGLGGDDTLNALGGNDLIDMSVGGDGEYGHDIIDGGGGTDLLYFGATMASGVNVDLGANTVSGGAPDSSASLTSIENVSGTGFDDTLTGSAGANLLLGLDGDDIIDGGGGSDTLDGGDGADLLAFGAATVSAVNVNLATNTVAGGATLASIENVSGTAFGDTLTGNSSANQLSGLGGSDTLVGGGGNDSLNGGEGTDLLAFGTVTSGVSVNLATNTASGGATLASIENVSGTAFGDTLTGNSSANQLSGQGGSDTLAGNGGADVLNGGGGADNLEGGAGADTMIWHASDNYDGGAGVDILKLSSGNLNLALIANSKILNVETINMAGGGGNTLKLNLQDVLAISSTTNTLKIMGEAGDTVNFVGAQGAGSAAAGGFTRYALGSGGVLLIDSDITVM